MSELTVIQGLWIGGSLTIMEQLSISSFIQNGHEYHLYCYDEVKGIPKGTLIKDANDVIPNEFVFLSEGGDKKPSYAGFSDLFRYKLLLDNGGFWCDTDTICLKPFDFKLDYVFGWEKSKSNDPLIINGAIIKAPLGCELLKFCYDRASQKDPKNITWDEIGPELFSAAVKKYELTGYSLPIHTFYPINWWDIKDIISDTLTARLKNMIRTRNSHAVHLYNELWRINKMNKNSKYSPLCLYEKLKSRYLNNMTN